MRLLRSNELEDEISDDEQDPNKDQLFPAVKFHLVLQFAQVQDQCSKDVVVSILDT